MAIRIKFARSAKEIDDALWLRHEVFVIEDGKYGGEALPGNRMVDRFDAFPHVYNIIAYDNDEPIATIRLIKESTSGLPVDMLFDFTNYRASVAASEKDPKGESKEFAPTQNPVFGSAGMLAIRENWRRRRDVIRAMFRMSAAICRSNGATHLLVVVNHDTAGMYRRLGFQVLSERFWVDSIENYVVPLATSTEVFLEWALGGVVNSPLMPFEDSFERHVLRAGEVVFSEGDVGHDAYVIESGHIKISRISSSGRELTLTQLTSGDLFGELALVDNDPRSATATATSDVELITLNRNAFLRDLKNNPERSQQLFKIFAGRLRNMDELAVALAFSPDKQRLDFALEIARRRASHDKTNPEQKIFRGGSEEFACIAAVEDSMAKEYLEDLSREGELELTAKNIVFFR